MGGVRRNWVTHTVPVLLRFFSGVHSAPSTSAAGSVHEPPLATKSFELYYLVLV